MMCLYSYFRRQKGGVYRLIPRKSAIFPIFSLQLTGAVFFCSVAHHLLYYKLPAVPAAAVFMLVTRQNTKTML
jgi:hypothetical protein